MEEERLYTVPEVAERFKVSVYAVRDWLRAGRIKGMQLGGRRAGWRVRASDLEAFLKESEQHGGEGERNS